MLSPHQKMRPLQSRERTCLIIKKENVQSAVGCARGLMKDRLGSADAELVREGVPHRALRKQRTAFCQREYCYEEGWFRGALSFSSKQNDPPVNARRHESARRAFRVFP
jgi:hypothetical protein